MSAFVHADVVINEFVASNGATIADEDGDYEDWIELYNRGATVTPLSGYGLSDDPDRPFRWVLPAVSLPPGEFLLIWASGKDRNDPGAPLHTNFSISSGGEPLSLTRPDGTQVDHVPALALPRDISRGRQPDGAEAWFYFDQPTPGAANIGQGYSEILDPPVFSHAGGFYTQPFDLTLQTGDPSVRIVYTLDGSIPDITNLGGREYDYKDRYPRDPGDPVGTLLTGSYRSMFHDDPIPIVSRADEPDRLTGFHTTYDRDPSGYAPVEPMFKGTMVRAMAHKDDALPSEVVTHTYFVTPQGGQRYTLPVLSLAIQEDHLFDYHNGIYVAGKDFDVWRTVNPNTNATIHVPANYKRRGPEHEHPMHLELIEPTGAAQQPRQLAQNLGARIHGHGARFAPMKSLRVYARGDYDNQSRLHYPLFEGLTDKVSGAPIGSFNRFLLRNGGFPDYFRTLMRDAAAQAFLRPLGLMDQAYQPAIHFINGEYWGIINLRERIDRFFIQSHFGVEPDNVAMMNGEDLQEGTTQDRQDYIDLRDYTNQHDLADPDHYAHVAQRMDIDNFLRYNVGEIYIANVDWPYTNNRYWRARTPNLDPTAPPEHDGRWRWILFDLDDTFGNATTNTLVTRAVNPQWPATMILRNLLDNPGFRNDFLNTFADYMNTCFKPQCFEAVADPKHARIQPYMDEHVLRWRNMRSTSIQFMRNFAHARPGHMRQHLIDYFGLPGTAEIVLNTAPDTGHFRVNRIVIDEHSLGLENPGAPYPWTGVYFQGVPIEIEAVPAPGFEFAGWDGLPPGKVVEDAVAVVMPGEVETLTAHFQEAPSTQLLHYWNFNDAMLLTPPTFSLGGGWLFADLSGAAQIEQGSGQGFAGENARMGEQAGGHLRVNNPLDAELTVQLPTTGYEEIVLQYETRRSGQGAGIQFVSYTVDGDNYTPHEAYLIEDDDPALRVLDFGAVPNVNDNSNFGVKIVFAQGEGGLFGNNRFDNITLDGRPLPGTNLPPFVSQPLETAVLAVGQDPWLIDLSQVFHDPEDDPLTYSAAIDDPAVAGWQIDGDWLTVTPLAQGETRLILSASDGQNPQVPTSAALLVYPEAFPLTSGAFSFTHWDANAPDGAYPDNMLFLQGEWDDLVLGQEPLRAYHIPHDDYNEDDFATIGFPYNNTRRTRINGLGQDGVAFINTGRERDLGAAVVALDTRGKMNVELSWLGGTLLRNERVYALRLQYRVGLNAPFQDVLHGGLPVEYVRNVDGHAEQLGPVTLPPDTDHQPYVQLRWLYHHIEGDIGPRAMLRLDEIHISTRDASVLTIY